MKFKQFTESFTVTKLNLPTSSPEFPNIKWNDKIDHSMFAKILSRTNTTRKDFQNKFIEALPTLKAKLYSGPSIVTFEKSKFKLSVWLENTGELVIKTILAYNMITRPTDRVLTIQEAENLFNQDLTEFYIDGFVNHFNGSFLIEESKYSEYMEVFIDEVIVPF